MGCLPFLNLKFEVIPNDLEEKMVSFYKSGIVSRVCPGKKDCVSVKIDGVKEHNQKCLLLGKLKEL